ncbi:MFS multidrug transporter [Mollisia scopiformis]|uniref:MFS multidrug transporter n=1 Tax=Mollisia scopiformis TaxID=149040 RepID=A0A194WYE4_MOLSC|nr:MFS multidrug transporter [Mollisia scopiformis]KUJ12632.1 MFS multidrug transporter [Mollisia scopiformis]
MSITTQELEKHSKEIDPEDQTSIEALQDAEPRLESKDGLQSTIAAEPKTSSAPDNEDADPEYIKGLKLAIVIGVVALASFTMLLDTSIVVTAIPRITSDFHSLDDVGWYGSAYLLSNSSLQPLTGKFYRQFSSKWTFLVFLGIFELGSLICGVAQSSKMLIVGRAVAGMGGSGLMNGGLTILAACSPPERRPTLMGFLLGFAQLGILLGPLLGGVLTQYTTWRWCFFINLPIGAVVAGILLLIQVPTRLAGKVPLTATFRSIFHVFDIGGFLLFAPSIIMCLLALEWGGSTYPWDSAKIIGLFCGAAGNFALFLYWEHRKGEGAMIPLAMFKNRIVWTSVVVAFFLGATMLITSYYMAIYFQAVRGRSPTMSGVDVVVGIVTTLICAVGSGILAVGRIGYYLPFAIGGAALNAIGCGLISTWTPTTSTGKWIGYQIIAGIGRGSGMQMGLVAISGALSAAENSIGMALLIFAQQFGGSVWLAVASTIFTNGLNKSLAKYAPEVDPKVVVNAGATGYRSVVPASAVPGVIQAYSQAVNYAFYLAAACGVAYFVFSWGMGWKSVKKPKKVEPAV